MIFWWLALLCRKPAPPFQPKRSYLPWIASPVLSTSLPKPLVVLQPVLTRVRSAVTKRRTTMRLICVVIFLFWLPIAGCDIHPFAAPNYASRPPFTMGCKPIQGSRMPHLRPGQSLQSKGRYRPPPHRARLPVRQTTTQESPAPRMVRFPQFADVLARRILF